MRQFLKRAALAVLSGVLLQFVFYLIAVVLGAPLLAVVLLLAGWLLVYAGRSSDPLWGLPVMLLINAIVYAPPIYLLLYWRPFREKEILSIRVE